MDGVGDEGRAGALEENEPGTSLSLSEDILTACSTVLVQCTAACLPDEAATLHMLTAWSTSFSVTESKKEGGCSACSEEASCNLLVIVDGVGVVSSACLLSGGRAPGPALDKRLPKTLNIDAPELINVTFTLGREACTSSCDTEGRGLAKLLLQLSVCWLVVSVNTAFLGLTKRIAVGDDDVPCADLGSELELVLAKSFATGAVM